MIIQQIVIVYDAAPAAYCYTTVNCGNNIKNHVDQYQDNDNGDRAERNTTLLIISRLLVENMNIE